MMLKLDSGDRDTTTGITFLKVDKKNSYYTALFLRDISCQEIITAKKQNCLNEYCFRAVLTIPYLTVKCRLALSSRILSAIFNW